MKDLYNLFRQSLAGLRVLIAATLLLGVAYPVAVYGAAAVAAPWKSYGSLVTGTGAHTTDADKAVGSALLGQKFGDDKLFQNRPSAAGDGYDAAASSGSNYGPENEDLIAAIEERQAAIAALDGVERADIPADGVTASGSGLDADISVAYAQLQVERVAEARGIRPDEVRDLVAAHVQPRDWGYLGEPRVNVLELNLALDALDR